MTLTNTAPGSTDVVEVLHTAFTQLPPPDNAEATAPAFITPEQTYTIAETFAAADSANPIAITQVTPATPAPVGCLALTVIDPRDPTPPEPTTVIGFANIPTITGGQAVLCAITSETCADGITIDGTTEAECEVENVVISTAQANGEIEIDSVGLAATASSSSTIENQNVDTKTLTTIKQTENNQIDENRLDVNKVPSIVNLNPIDKNNPNAQVPSSVNINPFG